MRSQANRIASKIAEPVNSGLPAMLLHIRILALFLAAACAALASDQRPNVLWITSEDHGPEMGCYGDAYAQTPNVDALAARGLRYNFAWSNAPVCAPARTTLISGVYATATGSEPMRSLLPAPTGKPPLPVLMREAGYYCANNVKTDYSLDYPDSVWNASSAQAHWRNRPEGAPFFAVFNSTKSHESRLRGQVDFPALHDPAKAPVPPFHPDTPQTRLDWARYYDSVSAADADAGAVLAQLQADGLAEDTIVFYFGDHGSGMPRSKRWPGDSGLRVPIVVHVPEKFADLRPADYAPGGASDRLVSFVDLAPTVMSLAGIEPPAWMQGRAFLGKHIGQANELLHGFRSRMDPRPDLARSVTDGRYVYIRNYRPDLPTGQHLDYQFETATTRIWHEAFQGGRTNAVQSAFWLPKSAEELYDLESDPHETVNLAGSPAHAGTLARLRAAQRGHAHAIRDVGFLPEAETHIRGGGRPPYDWANDDLVYPFERVFAAAERASLGGDSEVSAIIDGLKDTDSAVRYWSVRGLTMRGSKAVGAAEQTLLDLLSDHASPVAIVAAEALARHGSEKSRTEALGVLGRLADPRSSDYFSTLAALQTIDELGDTAAPIRELLRTFPDEHPQIPNQRYGGYLGQLLKHILG